MKSANNHSLKRFSQELRTEMTPEERRLWYCFLRNLPVPFRRQKIIGNYIADFYCPAFRLVIELDGEQHYSEQGIEYDKARDEYMIMRGYDVLRFSNADINLRFSAVCGEILKSIQVTVEPD